MKYCSRSLKEGATQCVRRQYNLPIVSYCFTNAFVLHTVPYNNNYYPSTTGYLDELIQETIRQSKEGTSPSPSHTNHSILYQTHYVVDIRGQTKLQLSEARQSCSCEPALKPIQSSINIAINIFSYKLL